MFKEVGYLKSEKLTYGTFNLQVCPKNMEEALFLRVNLENANIHATLVCLQLEIAMWQGFVPY